MGESQKVQLCCRYGKKGLKDTRRKKKEYCTATVPHVAGKRCDQLPLCASNRDMLGHTKNLVQKVGFLSSGKVGGGIIGECHK